MPSCEDIDVTEEHRMTVDGETFSIRRRNPNTYSYEWVPGRNPEYGFEIGASSTQEFDDDMHEEAIRRFLAEIDPRTGYLTN